MQTLDPDDLNLLNRIEGGQRWFAPEGCGGDLRPCTSADYQAFAATVAQLRRLRDATYIELLEHEVTLAGHCWTERAEATLKY